MNDLATTLLTQYYGFGAESDAKRFLSVPQCVENLKNEENQVTDDTSLPTDKDGFEEEFPEEVDDCRKLSITSDPHRLSSRTLDDGEEDSYNLNETLNIFEKFNLESNTACDFNKNIEQSLNNESQNSCTTAIADTSTENLLGEATEHNLSLTLDDSPDTISEVSSAILKESSRIGTPVPVIVKKQAICNETFADYSNTELKLFPNEILNKFSQLRMLYMAENCLTEIPSEVFSCLKQLEWLDVRKNHLTTLPESIKFHPCLETALLQDNMIEILPVELCTLPKLETLQVTRNPLISPPKEIVSSGFLAILEFLRNEWNTTHPDHQIAIKKSEIEPKLSTILCYQSPRKNKKSRPSKTIVLDKTVFSRVKQKRYKPSSRCENSGANTELEQRLLCFSKLTEMINKQTAILQKMKDKEVLKDWRTDKKSFTKAMEKASKRSEDDIPFGFDLEDYASIFKQIPKSKNLASKKMNANKFSPPKDINKGINDLFESLNQLQIKNSDEVTPRSKQTLLSDKMEKLLQLQNEIQNLRKHNDVAALPLQY